MAKSFSVFIGLVLALAIMTSTSLAGRHEGPAMSKDQKSQKQSQDRKDAGKAAHSASHPPVVVLVPVQAYSRAEALGDGCWVKLYASNDYKGSQFTVIGPAELPRVEDNIPIAGFDSAIVGPKARVTTYDGENFEDKSATMNPGQRIPDLDEKLGFFEDIESLQVRCG